MKRLLFQLLITVVFALVGALVSTAFWPEHVPVLGLVIAGAIGYGFSLVLRD